MHVAFFTVSIRRGGIPCYLILSNLQMKIDVKIYHSSIFLLRFDYKSTYEHPLSKKDVNNLFDLYAPIIMYTFLCIILFNENIGIRFMNLP